MGCHSTSGPALSGTGSIVGSINTEPLRQSCAAVSFNNCFSPSSVGIATFTLYLDLGIRIVLIRFAVGGHRT